MAGTRHRTMSLLKNWIILHILATSTTAKRVTLLDTMETSGELGYTTHKESSSGYGWRENSWRLDDQVHRGYSVCDVSYTGANNWVRLPYIERGEANHLYVEIGFTMRTCIGYTRPEELIQCKSSITVHHYEAESDFATDSMPTWGTSQGAYQLVDSIAADPDKLIVNGSEDFLQSTNIKTRSIAVTQKGVYFAIQDMGACTSLLWIKVYYIACSSVTLNFAQFPETATGLEVTSVVQRRGRCVPNAIEDEEPSYLCTSAGTWGWLMGGCQCLRGNEPYQNTECRHCPVGKYKHTLGNTPCVSCPANSHAPNTKAIKCDCKPGYHRYIGDDETKPCSEPPAPPNNLTLVSFDQTMVVLTWIAPPGVPASKVVYHVVCQECPYGTTCRDCSTMVKYHPKQKGFNTTRIEVQGLNPSTTYEFKVYSKSNFGLPLDSFQSSVKRIETKEAVPSKVHNVNIGFINKTSITLHWDRPEEEHMVYEVKYYPVTYQNNASSVTTNRLSWVFNDLRPNTQYGFQVRGKTKLGWGEWSDPKFGKTQPSGTQSPKSTARTTGTDPMVTYSPPTSSDHTEGIIAAAAVAVIVSLVIVAVMVVIYLKRNNNACHEKTPSDCDQLQYHNEPDRCGMFDTVQGPPLVVVDTHSNGLTVPLFAPPGVRTYIDPHTYEDPQQAVREFTKEIDASHITIESVIGGGEFGDVCKGKLRIPGKMELTVAIKTLKPGSSDKSRLDFLTEASIMGQFEDPNVIYLEGVVTKSNPIMIITEYMENGALDQFLRTNDGKFTVIQLVGMLRGIASGMRYLDEAGYIHRDLAARNILVNDNLVCKVADFGLSREIEADNTDGAYTTKGGKIPVRWTAPEAISYRKFTAASDVWSYGVVAWEVMSYGERPYWNWSNQDVIKAVEKGYRLPPPMDCPEACHQLMLDCWQKERNNRPKFAQIVKTLDKLIRAPELLRKIAKPRPHNIFDPTVPDMTRFTTVDEWLASIKMERYIENFLRAGYENMDQVSRITITELVKLGITLVGHQKKLMNSIQTLRAQLSGAAQMSEGFLV